jgi:diguanylate cyclase (GGDEF)-like protein
VKGYLLPASFGLQLLIVKVVGLVGGYIFTWLSFASPEHAGAMYYGPPVLFWGTLAFFLAANSLLLLRLPSHPDHQERVYLLCFFLDLIAIGYMDFFQAPAYVPMLIGLAMVCGFYNFVLSRTSGIMTTGMVMVIYCLGVLSASQGILAGELTFGPLAMIVLGLAVLFAVAYLVRKVRRTIDHVFTTTDELAFDLTSQAVDASILVDELIEKNREIQTLIQVLHDIVSVLEWDSLFKNIVQAFRHRFKFDKFSLYLYDSEKGVLELRHESGAEKLSSGLAAIRPGDGVVGWCYANKRGVVINDVRTDERYREFSERGKRIRSLCCVPLDYRGQQLGVLCLDSEKPSAFDERASGFLAELGPLISIAVQNSMNYVAVKEESHTDPLTGLKNRRGFMEIFLPLLSSSYCDDFSMALIIMDIDDFKKVNDTYGHPVGDLLLTDLAEILKTFFRGTDIVARFGGEEFVVVLNGTPPDIAPRIAEQLRRKVEAHQFPISLQRDAFKQVTLSLGLATTGDTNLKPEIISGSRGRQEQDVYVANVQELAEQLIENADQALYVAKREGKNQVRLSFQYPNAPQGELDAPERE